jgi:ABC-type uncharacterized transport system YnjBCD ATPase subunit
MAFAAGVEARLVAAAFVAAGLRTAFVVFAAALAGALSAFAALARAVFAAAPAAVVFAIPCSIVKQTKQYSRFGVNAEGRHA